MFLLLLRLGLKEVPFVFLDKVLQLGSDESGKLSVCCGFRLPARVVQFVKHAEDLFNLVSCVEI